MGDARDPGGRPDPDGLDRLVEAVLAGSASTPVPGDGLGATLHRLRALAEEPLPAASRARHLRRIHVGGFGWGAPGPAPTRPRRVAGLRRRLTTLATAATALLLLAGGGTVAAAQDAVPDDVLYGVKRASEQAWTAFPRDSEGAARVHLTLALRRLDEADRAPGHAARLVDEGLERADAAAEELPEEAIEGFVRKLGDGEGALPPQASPVARAALHRNCVRIATRHDLGPERCGDAPEVAHPGNGRGHGPGSRDEAGPPGWGPGGRPDGETGPPAGTPNHERWHERRRERSGDGEGGENGT